MGRMSQKQSKSVMKYIASLLIVFVLAIGSARAQSQSETVIADTETFSEKPITWYDYPEAELRALDKVTARTTTFKVKVGKPAKFGKVYMKVQACRKPPAIEKVESSAFIQVWEKPPGAEKSKWVFSGWMFASSPSLSAMDHPIYDVWLLDCLGPKPQIEQDISADRENTEAAEETTTFESMIDSLQDQ